MKTCAIYMRSSKDRAEMGLPAQRKALTQFASTAGLRVVAEFEDMEISGSLDEVSRPGLRSMLTALTAPDRGWAVLLALDPSRIARDMVISLFVQRECERAGVALQYAKLPVDGGSAFGEAMLNVMRTFDRLHARLSAEKGRMGLEANVAQGFRAGGRAPTGYTIERTATGGKRGGDPVVKAKLILDPDLAPAVGKFLKLRASGTARSIAATKAGLDKDHSTLIGIERNALMYAGYTVWNRSKKGKPSRDNPARTATKRGRDEWIVSERPTHPALITRAEAERLLAKVPTNAKSGPPAGRPSKVRYILTGLLQTPDGKLWTGDGDYYRVAPKGARMKQQAVEELVLGHIAEEIRGKQFLADAVQAARALADGIVDTPDTYAAPLATVGAKITKLVDLVETTGNASLIERLQKLETERDHLQALAAQTAHNAALKRNLQRLDIGYLEAWFDFFPISPKADPATMRGWLEVLVQRVELDPVQRRVRVHYRLQPAKDKRADRVASPQGYNDYPTIEHAGRWRALPGTHRLPKQARV